MNSYMDKKHKQQAINAWRDLLAQVLTPEELSLVKLKFVNGRLRRCCPMNIEEKTTKLSGLNQQ
jgi:hypothetical protein